MDRDASNLPQLIAHARAGNTQALDQTLSLYRNYLRLMARTQLSPAFNARLDPSDVAQEVLLEAYRDFKDFAGQSERELLNWLRKILARTLADLARRHNSKKRDVRRDQSLEAMLERSCQGIDDLLTTQFTTPSQAAAQRERSVVLADALASLPTDQREVIIQHHLERRTFVEIGQLMERSPGAVRMLWVRGLEKLRAPLENLP